MKLLQPSLILILGFSFFSFTYPQTKEDHQHVVTMDTINNTQHYTNVADSYMRGLNEKDLEGILSLYADNAMVEDPVGSKIVSGKAALREFYTGAVNIELTVTRTGPVRASGMEAAFPFELLMEVNGTMMRTDIIDVFRFDEAGKIVSMRAFWGPDNRRPANE